MGLTKTAPVTAKPSVKHALTYEGHSDIDGKELTMELQSVPDLPSKEITAIDFLTHLPA